MKVIADECSVCETLTYNPQGKAKWCCFCGARLGGEKGEFVLLDRNLMQNAIDSVEQGLASVVGKRLAAAAVGKVDPELERRRSPSAHPALAAPYGKSPTLNVEEFNRQYMCTPQTIRKQVEQQLRNNHTSLSGKYLESLTDRQLLEVANKGVEHAVWRQFKQQIEDAAERRERCPHTPEYLIGAVHQWVTEPSAIAIGGWATKCRQCGRTKRAP